MVELLPSKQVTGVRFPPPAYSKTLQIRRVFSFPSPFASRENLITTGNLNLYIVKPERDALKLWAFIFGYCITEPLPQLSKRIAVFLCVWLLVSEKCLFAAPVLHQRKMHHHDRTANDLGLHPAAPRHPRRAVQHGACLRNC